MSGRRDAAAAIAVVLLVVMVAGEVLTYADPYDYGSSVGYTDDGPEYTVSSSAAAEFTVVQLVSEAMVPPDRVYVYYDGDYGTVGITEAASAVEDMIHDLSIHGMDATVVDAEGLGELMSTEGGGVGVIFLTGAAPSTVYTGAEGDPLLRWMSSGGSVYWVGPTMGKYVAWPDGEVTEVEGWEDLFYGAGCFNDAQSRESAVGQRDEIGEAICIMSSSSQYGMSSDVEGCLQLGYVSEDGYGSVALAPYGSGMLCVVGGSYDDSTRTDLVQVVASGVTYCSEIVWIGTVDVSGGSASGRLVDVDGSYVYIFCGGYYSPYGQRHALTQ